MTGDKVIPELHLREKIFAYSACSPFTKCRDMIQKQKTGHFNHIYKKVDKACFVHYS